MAKSQMLSLRDLYDEIYYPGKHESPCHCGFPNRKFRADKLTARENREMADADCRFLDPVTREVLPDGVDPGPA